ncbi:MAG: hypothetical protein ACTH1D_01725 [Mycobacteriaceae bacterium]|uniref:GAP1-N2 domain-containing protein n=1 Tax=Corynebacterium variabile TaxID=1727 RepID=UPI003FB80557
MSGSFSYASFSASDERPGGWSVGRTAGDVEDMWIADLVPLIPTQLADPVPLSNFPDKDDLARRVRRFAWLPAPWDPVDTGVFFASSPAGQDASGRPGNVFTWVAVSDTGRLPHHDAVSLMLSPSVPAPFGKRKVDTAELPELGPGFSGPVPSPLTPDVTAAFLAGAPAESAGGTASLPVECSRITEPSGPASRTEILRRLLELLMNGQPVVLATDPAEGPLWVTVLAEKLPADLPFTWSTYERATGLSEVLETGASLVVLPPKDLDRLPADLPAVVVDTAAQLPPADAVAPPAPAAPQRARHSAGAKGWGVSFIAPASSAQTVASGSASPSNPFGSATPDTAATPVVRAAQNGVHPGLILLNPLDEEFIRTAGLTSWGIWVDCLQPDPHVESNADFLNRWYRKGLTAYEYYLLLDPSTELGWTARIRILALTSYGYVPPSKDTPDRTSLNEWALAFVDPRTEEELIDDTVDYSYEHGYADKQPPDFRLLRNPSVRDMAEEVFRRRVERRQQGQQTSPAPQHARHNPQPSHVYDTRQPRQPRHIQPGPGHPGNSGWSHR